MNSNDALNHADQELCEANYEDFKLLYDAYCASDVRYDYINRQIVKK
jgi:hypothetical protein